MNLNPNFFQFNRFHISRRFFKLQLGTQKLIPVHVICSLMEYELIWLSDLTFSGWVGIDNGYYWTKGKIRLMSGNMS